MNARREYAVTVVLMGLAGLGVVVSFGATWVVATVPVFVGEPTPTRVVDITGSALFGFATAAGWVGVASMAGVIATRSWGRRVIGVIAALSGAAAGVAALTFIFSRGPLVNSALSGDQAIAVEGNAWWALAAVSGLGLVVTGCWTAIRGRAWSVLSQRYEAPSRARAGEAAASTPENTATPAPSDGGGSVQMWDALDRGQDPT